MFLFLPVSSMVLHRSWSPPEQYLPYKKHIWFDLGPNSRAFIHTVCDWHTLTLQRTFLTLTISVDSWNSLCILPHASTLLNQCVLRTFILNKIRWFSVSNVLALSTLMLAALHKTYILFRHYIIKFASSLLKLMSYKLERANSLDFGIMEIDCHTCMEVAFCISHTSWQPVN